MSSRVGERAVVLDYVDTYSRLRVFDKEGGLEGEIELPGKGLVNRTGSFFSFFNVTNTMLRGEGDHIDFLFATPSTAPAYCTADVVTRAVTQLTPPERTIDAQVLDCTARSRDGAEVVYHIVARRDLDLSKPHPTVITGYGGFNLAVLPGWFGKPLGDLDRSGRHIRPEPFARRWRIRLDLVGSGGASRSSRTRSTTCTPRRKT